MLLATKDALPINCQAEVKMRDNNLAKYLNRKGDTTNLEIDSIITNIKELVDQFSCKDEDSVRLVCFYVVSKKKYVFILVSSVNYRNLDIIHLYGNNTIINHLSPKRNAPT